MCGSLGRDPLDGRFDTCRFVGAVVFKPVLGWEGHRLLPILAKAIRADFNPGLVRVEANRQPFTDKTRTPSMS
jgi:hypothetical protein